MGILYINWTDTQYELHFEKISFVFATAAAFVTVLTQYAVSEWIWFGDGDKPKRRPHNAPVYLIAGVPFLYLWSTIYNCLQLLATFLQASAPPIPPLGDRIATPLVGLGGVLLNLAFCWIWTKVFPQSAEDTADDKDNGEVEPEPEVVARPMGPAENVPPDEDQQPNKNAKESPPASAAVAGKKKPKILYINNVKIFLTILVILQHSINCWNGGGDYVFSFQNTNEYLAYALGSIVMINQSYFMHLFFFFSGYFVPKSFDKRGTKTFLLGRARRLGIPLVFTAYFFGCFRYIFEQALYDGSWNPQHTRYLIWYQDQCWFLLQLILFGVAYAFACGKGWSPKISCPSMLGFFKASIVLGVWAALFTAVFPGTHIIGVLALMWVPNAPSVYLSYFLFFLYGGVAQRNDWMKEIKSKSRFAIYGWATLTLLVSLPYPLYGLSDYGDIIFTSFFMNGFAAIPYSLAVTVFFMDHLNEKFFFTDFFAVSMYTAYIIHRYPIFVGKQLFLMLLGATNSVVATEGKEVFISAGLVVSAILFIWVFAMVVTWPLAYGIRSIPGFSKVL